MNTYTERITKLATKLDSVDAKINEYQNQREAIVAEIQGLVAGTSAKTTVVGKKDTVTLGEKIVNFLTQTTDGQTNPTIAAKIKSTPQKTSLAMYHLIRKGQVTQNGDRYFISNRAMAKTGSEVTEE